ncbi:MAG: hypothetical protein SOY06_08895 [Prevotella sp.]|nr:hypothetical protein [Prevotella sp.]
MAYLILILVALGLACAVWELLQQRRGKAQPAVLPESSSCSTCDGTGAKCEQECMMEAATKDIVYFNDEELDSYRGRASDAYSDQEAEEFAEVMYTMRPDEVREWNRSLILRGVNMPDQIKDEFISLASGE